MISSPNRSRRSGPPVRLVVIHTAEGARTTTSLGSYFSRASVQASSHAGIDDQGIETYVPYSEAAWTLRSGNSISDNVELCGFAAWSRAQWLNEHRRMLELTAQWIRERCLARNIPIRKLTPQQVAAGQAGVCGHIDWTIGMRDGTHTDPGPGFPWDVVMELASRGSGGTPPISGGDFFMALTDSEQREILDGIRRLKPGVVLPARSPNAVPKQDDAFGAGLNAWAEAANARAAVEALARQITAGPVAGPATLSDADVQRIASAVVKLLGAKASV